MTPILRSAALVLVALSVSACRISLGQSVGSRDSAELLQREDRLVAALGRVDSTVDTPLARWLLPHGLAEISGLALTPDQRLLAHGDEVGHIFEVDYRRGVIVKSFWVGAQPVHEDFEAIAVSGDRIFLLASNGKIYEFREGARRDACAIHAPRYQARQGVRIRRTGLRFPCE